MEHQMFKFGLLDQEILETASDIVKENSGSEIESSDTDSSEEYSVYVIETDCEDEISSGIEIDIDDINSVVDMLIDKNDCDQSYAIPSEPMYGCKHYLRRCKIVAPCCSKIYSCRLCHDDEMNDFNVPIKDQHCIDRFKIQKIICTNCDLEQDVSKNCINCNTCFGMYFCKICRLFDDIERDQYHCDKCGFCRIGNKNGVYHCNSCNICMSMNFKDDHICKNMKETYCPICLQDIFSSTDDSIMMKCEHYIHKRCFYELLKKDFKCPLCQASVVDISEYNKIMDQEVNATLMPEEYKDKMINIMCNDCHHKAELQFHIVGYKCPNCESYNTKPI